MHPHSNNASFHEVMKERLIYLNGKRKQVFILGDININFLQYCNTDNAADYPDMQFDLGFMPMITKTIRDKHAVLRKLSNKKRTQRAMDNVCHSQIN